MTLVLRYAARSDRGLVRSNNQDSVYAGPRLLALADGMGGHAAGEVASKVVIASLAQLDDDEPGDDLLSKLSDAMANGNAAISELVAGDPDLEGMGTTLTAMLFSGSKLGMLHVGDSRAYLLRDEQFAQITRDDSFVNELIEQGRITEEQAATHPQRSLLLKALTGNEIEPALTMREARVGDRYLLCSDGLSGMVSYETLCEAVKIPDPQECADRMIELALKGGGTDNVTVIIADVAELQFGDDAPIVGGAAGDGSDQHNDQGDSPAARARALDTPPPPRVDPQAFAAQGPVQGKDRGRRGKRIKVLVGVLLVLVLLGAGAVTARYFVMQQYYVGVGPGDEVVIYRGITGSILGFELHEIAERSCPAGAALCDPLRLKDLQQSARNAVSTGVPRESKAAAREYIDTLRAKHTLEYCETTGGRQRDTGQSPGGSSDLSGSTDSGDTGGIGSGAATSESANSTSTRSSAEPGGQARQQDGPKPGADCRPAPSADGG